LRQNPIKCARKWTKNGEFAGDISTCGGKKKLSG